MNIPVMVAPNVRAFVYAWGRCQAEDPAFSLLHLLGGNTVLLNAAANLKRGTTKSGVRPDLMEAVKKNERFMHFFNERMDAVAENA